MPKEPLFSNEYRGSLDDILVQRQPASSAQTRWDSVAFSLHDFGGAASVDSSFPMLSLWNWSLFIQLKAFTVGEQRSLLAGHCGMAYLKMEISTSRAWISCLRMSLFRWVLSSWPGVTGMQDLAKHAEWTYRTVSSSGEAVCSWSLAGEKGWWYLGQDKKAMSQWLKEKINLSSTSFMTNYKTKLSEYRFVGSIQWWGSAKLSCLKTAV